MEGTNLDDYPPDIIPVADVVDEINPSRPGLMELTKVDDYNPEIVPVSDVVDNIYPSRPGMHSTPSERVILEKTEQPVLNLITDAPARDAFESLPVSDATSQHMTTGAVMNVVRKNMKKPLTAEKREEINARRRANYRKKKEEGTVKFQDENQLILTVSELATIQCNMEERRELVNARRRAGYCKKSDKGTTKLRDVAQNVPQTPLADITNGYQQTSVILDEKKEQVKAWRRAAYRRKKDEAVVKQQDENLPALTISGNGGKIRNFQTFGVHPTLLHAQG